MDSSTSAQPLVRIRDVHKRFGSFEALRGVNLDIYPGEVVALIGASGSGKSTLCRCINRLETISSGSIEIDGRPLPQEGKELAALRAEIGMVFQSFNLFEHKTALDNIDELAKGGMTMLIVTHEMGFARQVADRVAFIDDGNIVEDAPPEEFFTNPKTERARAFLSKILNH